MLIPDLILWSIAYVVGLAITAIRGDWDPLPLSTLILSLICLGAAAIVPRRWFGSPRSVSWCIAAAIVWGAALNLYWQTPRPSPQSPQDVSLVLQQLQQQQPPDSSDLSITVLGRIRSIPTLNTSDRVRFELEATEVTPVTPVEQNYFSSKTAEASQPPLTDHTTQTTQGCLYTTVPLLQGTGLQDGQGVKVTGRAYQPKAANNPAGFDFQQYLARQGCFAGLSGQTVTVITPTSPGWWNLRQRILKAQVGALGSPYGTLVSAMVMGSQAVDLPQSVRQDFARAGLAHTIAASGFHVTLLVGCVLWLTQGRSPLFQGVTGFLSLLGLLGLTGPQPSIVRAVVMGSVGLLGLVLQRRTQPLGVLSLAGILLLLLRPLWIWDLGFQLSFLATFGLITTATPVSQHLDFLPPRLGSLLSVPIAATLWTLPILLYQFGVVSPYSIGVNVLATLPVVVISLGGMISGLGAILSIPLGTFLAQMLYLPVKFLFLLVQWCLALPGSTWAVGSISTFQLILLYALFLLIWRCPPSSLQRSVRWAGVGLAIVFALVPNWYSQRQLSQLTIVAGANPPVLMLQDQGKAAMVNSGGEDTVRYTILPYLQNQGLNRLQWAVSSQNTTVNRDGWLRMWQTLKVDRFVTSLSPTRQKDLKPEERWSLEALQTALANQQATIAPLTCGDPPDPPQKTSKTSVPQTPPTPTTCTPVLFLGRWQLTLLQPDGSLWELQDQTHLHELGFLLLNPSAQTALITYLQHRSASPNSPLSPWLWWTGKPLTPQLLEVTRWQWAAATATQLQPETIAAFREHSIPLYWTGQDGALQWQPGGEPQSTIGLNDR